MCNKKPAPESVPGPVRFFADYTCLELELNRVELFIIEVFRLRP